MEDKTKANEAAKRSKDAFSNVAIWQFMVFILLLCFIWANEILDLTSRMFGESPSDFNFFRACLLSAAVVTAGIVAVGHTYEKQKSIVEQLLMTCLYCHRVQNSDGEWEHVEEYFIRHYPIAINRAPCPDCAKMLASVDAKITDEKEKKT